MEKLPVEICFRIFQLLDHKSLTTANQVSRKWRILSSDNSLWCDLFKKRWGQDSAQFYAPQEPKTWKGVYTVQNRCDRYGLGVKIIREGTDYYLISQGEIQRHLSSSQNKRKIAERTSQQDEGSAISDRLLFFLGDLETACANAKLAKI
ncbi:hypothetical protein LUZ60_016443 [Juncus effusus]|nr:hypothetical protein LUZ60_016443 [Juncus effusus]